MFLETDTSRPEEGISRLITYISRLGKLVSRLIVHAG